MNYEKAYNQALERARDYYKANIKLGKADENLVLEDIFPELVESDDERIRKELKHYLEVRRCQTQSDEEYINCNHFLTCLEKQGEPKEYTFKSIPRLLDMIEPTERAKAYTKKLINTLTEEGYITDAKIVEDCLKQMNGEVVAMAVMDEKQGEQKPIDEDKTEIYDQFTPFEERLCALTHACQILSDEGKIKFIKKHSQEILDIAKKQIEIEQKPAWSEEDESCINDLLEFFGKGNCLAHEVNDIIYWLKSLKERMK